MRIRTLVVMSFMAIAVSAQQYPYQDVNRSAAERAADLCSRLSLEEKTQLMMNNSPAIKRWGIPEFNWWNEALHGVGRNGYATVFPITMAMAATWDHPLVERIFTAVSDEARAKNALAKKKGEIKIYQCLSFWTPNINIFRDPRWGRGQETYGEDPYLTSMMGCAVVRGLQGPEDNKYRKLLACAKHFAVHSGPEWNRHQFNVENLPARDLWETYLPAFKSLVQDAHVAEIMCAYQQIDSEPCCGNSRYLQQILRNEWGFPGLVVSDCGAIGDFWRPNRHNFVKTREEAAAKAVISGTDVECGSDYKSLPEALKAGYITEQQIDVSVRRLLQMRFELGDFDPDEMVPWTKMPASVVACKEHKDLALKAARESMVLLQNDGTLPLSRSQKIVVIGPNAKDSVMLWGNYNGMPTTTTTILQGIQQKAPQARYIDGCGHVQNTNYASIYNQLSSDLGKQGLKATYWNNEEMKGNPVISLPITEPIHLDNGGNTTFAQGVALENFSACYEGTFQPKEDATIVLNFNFEDYGRLIFDGDTLIQRWHNHGVGYHPFEKKVKKGKKYPVKIEYIQQKGLAYVEFDITEKKEITKQSILDQAKEADVVIFVGGISPRLEGEEMKVDAEGFRGGDRTNIELPKVQREMIADLKALGKKVVYVNCSGSAIGMVPESEHVNAILQAWYAGEKGGEAVADVLFGDYNPGGKLPVTFYQNVEQLPDFEDYTMKGRTYRYFEGKPLFPFGYGLSYTSFKLSKPKYRNGKVQLTITNTGNRDGSEVIQVYIRNPKDREGPLKTLRAYQRVEVKAGQQKLVEIPLPREQFELWDAETNTMRVKAGKYEVMAGTSSADNDLRKINVTIK